MGIVKCPMCGEKLNGEKVCGNCGTNIKKLEESLCRDCNGILKRCPECNNPITPDAEICGQCGYNISDLKNKICKCCNKKTNDETHKDAEYQKINGNRKRRWLLIGSCVVVIFVCFIVYTQVHIYAEATCTEPKTCRICKKTEGSALHHKWLRECEKVETCERCGLEVGEPLEHSWKEATCEEPKICTRCKKTEGEPLGHDLTWEVSAKATLTKTGYESEVCKNCHKVINSNEIEKKKPGVEGEHFNFGALEFIEYFKEILSSASLNMDVEMNVKDTLLADNNSGGVAFAVPITINSNEEVQILLSENKENYVESIFFRGSENGEGKGRLMALFAVMGGSLTDSDPQTFAVNLFAGAQQKGIFFYSENGIRFTEIPDDTYYIMGAVPIK